jgi:hypothetical protein
MMTRTKSIDDDKKYSLAGLYLLKKMDLKPKEGGMEFPAVLPNELSPLDDVFQHMALDGLVEIDKRTFGADRWKMTKKGIERLRQTIDEASEMIDEYDDYEVDEAIAELRAQNLDVFRCRFLWGWFEGEFDDLVIFQERRGVSPVERMWAIYLTGDDFWNEIAKDLEV